MAKMYKNLWLFGPDLSQENTTRLLFRQTAEDYKSDLLHNGLTSAVKLVFLQEDFGNPLH